jgi:tetratricopeptide (TPR) repeat protein
MKFKIATCVAAFIFTALPVMAQQQQAAATKGPQPKSQKELEALQKWQTAAQSGNPDQELAAINNVLENFADTEFKSILISRAMQDAEQKDDPALVTTWTERALQDDPNSIEAHVVMAQATARHTRENDLDKAESIKKIQTNANKALELLKTADKPPAAIPEAEWPAVKKQLTGQAYDALGQASAVDKKYPDAITAYKAGVAADPAANVIKVRLAKAYVDNKEYDSAISTADQVIADASAQQVVKNFAQAQKDNATKLKGATAAAPK